MTTEQIDELDETRSEKMRRSSTYGKPPEMTVTQISFTDRGLDTISVGEKDVVRVEDRGVWLTRVDFRGSAWTSFYPWSSVFSLTYA